MSYAKQQWLLSYIIGKYMKIKLLPAIIHTHGKYPLEERIRGDYGYKFLINTEIVLLNHAIAHPKETLIRKQDKCIKKIHRRMRRMYYFIGILILLCVFLSLKIIWE
jgi:hypothetical protein